MYNKLVTKLKNNCIGDFENTEGKILLKYKGKYNDKNMNVVVAKGDDGNKSRFIITFDKEKEILYNEQSAIKHLTNLFLKEYITSEKDLVRDFELDIDSVDDIKDADEIAEASKEDEELSLEEKLSNKTGIVGVLDGSSSRKARKNKIAELGYNPYSVASTLEYMRKNKIGNYIEEQVGYLDKTMPKKTELTKLAKGIKPCELSNQYSGMINNALRRNDFIDRYRLIYVKGNYYCYDKENSTVISIVELLELMPDEISNANTLKNVYNSVSKQSTKGQSIKGMLEDILDEE